MRGFAIVTRGAELVMEADDVVAMWWWWRYVGTLLTSSRSAVCVRNTIMKRSTLIAWQSATKGYA